MKELNRKRQETENSLPQHLEHNKVNIFDQKTIAEEFSSFFNHIGPEYNTNIIPNSCDILILYDFLHHFLTRKRS